MRLHSDYARRGVGDGDRTRDLDVGNVVLYQLSYAHEMRRRCGALSPDQASNLGPPIYEIGATAS